MRTIYKYHLRIEDDQDIALPKGAEILKVANVKEEIYLWAKVDTDEPLVPRHFKMYGTGHQIKDENVKYCDSVIMRGGMLVLHVFEVPYVV